MKGKKLGEVFYCAECTLCSSVCYFARSRKRYEHEEKSM